MKHTIKITLFLLLIFVASQLVGLSIISKYLDFGKTVDTGKVAYSNLPLGFERPDVDASTSFIYIVLGVIIGTLIFLLVIKFKSIGLWKLWFLLAVGLCLTFAFYAFIPVQYVALGLAIVLAVWKIFKPNMFVHNITEIFIYGGLAAIFVPVINMWSAFAILVLISIYDMYAVWKSKHMVKMAQFQSSSKVFAGIYLPYTMKEKSAEKVKGSMKATKVQIKGKSAILGGGDIAFPLLFSGAVMNSLALTGYTVAAAMLLTLIITVFVTAALAMLLYYGEQDRFYPAMPFISVGCILGYLVILLI